MDNKKGFLQISFAGLFAIIVGAIILSFTIYAVTKTIGNQETITSAKTAKEIGVLLNPLETGFEIGKTTTLIFPTDTRIYNICQNKTGFFGKQNIYVSQKSFDEWTETDLEVSFENKYIFSEEFVEGKTFYLFSKPFEFPFKISDVIYLTSSKRNYCFVGPPENIKDELESLKQPNILVNDCQDKSNQLKVCFSGEACDIEVDYASGRVKRGSNIMYFKTDALMYAAIFSDKEVYECQLQRLMDRVNELSNLYQNKERFVAQRGCNSNIGGQLAQLSNAAESLRVSANLESVSIIAESVDEENELNSQCRLY